MGPLAGFSSVDDGGVALAASLDFHAREMP
jgi:hypothetical protein